MKSLFARRPSPAMVIALVALFVSLSGVSYGVATGFIDSREIKNNEVRSRDVRNNEIRTIDLRNNQVRGIDIRNSSVQGRDIALNTVTGTDVNESTLGKVPSAANADSAATAAHATNADNATNATTAQNAANADTVGGIGPDALTIGRSALGSCEPGAAFTNCTTVNLSMPRPGRVLLNAGGQWHSDDAAGTSVRGLCRINLDGNPLTGVTEEGSLSQQTDGNQEQALAGVTSVTGVLPAGDHTFTVACSDDVGDMDFTDVRLSAVLLGSS